MRRVQYKGVREKQRLVYREEYKRDPLIIKQGWSVYTTGLAMHLITIIFPGEEA